MKVFIVQDELYPIYYEENFEGDTVKTYGLVYDIPKQLWERYEKSRIKFMTLRNKVERAMKEVA